jgi:hypothetical protein
MSANRCDKDSLHLSVMKRAQERSLSRFGCWLKKDFLVNVSEVRESSRKKLCDKVQKSKDAFHAHTFEEDSESVSFENFCGVKKLKSRPNSFQVLCFYRDRGCCERFYI